uniref:Peptidase S8/S53 domain-containing protein n=1 Tax=Oryza punctata TaxID=4537 RepID=A0A0E0JPR3_ORYPU
MTPSNSDIYKLAFFCSKITQRRKMEFHSCQQRLASVLLLCFWMLFIRAHGSHKLYITYLGDRKHAHIDDVVASHHDTLSSVLGSKEESLSSIIYNYKHGFSGFAAMLTEEQAEQLAELPEVISVQRSRRYKTTTTRSWDFLGLNYQNPSELQRRSNHGEDIIIGVVDTGIWPESRSFSDEGYGPVPARWKGVCQVGEGWGSNNCSRKIIGARFYHAGVDEDDLKIDYLSPRDVNGHGTHTASTAAGSVVEAVSFHGLATGTARGGAPRARIAVYKSVWGRAGAGSGNSATVLAAIDDAIHDGVDVLSLSLGTLENSFGALHAVQKGITVVYAAMNFGPAPQVVRNTAPWVITVAASKIDRSFPTVITLGDKRQIVGQSMYYYEGNNSSGSSFRLLAYGGLCTKDDLNGTDVKGRIVLCISIEISPLILFPLALKTVLGAGASGLIFAQYTTDLLGITTACNGTACVLVDLESANLIGTYISEASSPMAKIEPARTITGEGVLAPKVAAFSSRGPSVDYPDIIKPDIAAPGSNILAAMKDHYQLGTGTSMATPHVAGVVALLKAFHPDWSPAAIKSAIVTTASVTDERGMPILAEGVPRKIADPFDYGGGHINPNRAADPGLIYDIDPSDYNKFFGCIIKTSVSCNATTLPGYHLNLPSIAVPDLRDPTRVSRTVTNVGEVNAVYHAEIQSPPGEDSLASIIHNYKHGFSGFAVMLTEDQAKQLAEFPEVLSVEPSITYTTATTRSWDMLGLNYRMPTELLHRTNYGEEIIIGIVDTGIWPESRSFSDEGYGPVPARWRGVCQVGEGWDSNNCSRKIVGARFYHAGVDEENLKIDYLSPRDANGHGTHTASTAAGSVVEAVSFHGLAEGTARGGAPRARIAVYKSMWGSGSGVGSGNTATVLAAIDDAIHDGVDVLSLSLGTLENSFGALHAVQKGITVVYAAMNLGPAPQVVQNTAPWVITVAASKIDRSFPTVITLGDKRQIVVRYLQTSKFKRHDTNTKNKSVPRPVHALIIWTISLLSRDELIAKRCTEDALNGTDVKGSIVLCASFTLNKPSILFQEALGNVVKGGGIGMIFVLYTEDIVSSTARCNGIACVIVDYYTVKQIGRYILSASSPIVKIDPARTVTGNQIMAPKVADFSSRGPSTDYPEIIKKRRLHPDIAAPGSNILAAVKGTYAFASGTSMATPHVAGVVALLKALHPSWSPAALKSAIVTTASVTDERGMPILAEGLPRKIADPFDYGGGHINPNRAADPGLIYDIDPRDYNKFFGCTVNPYVSCNATLLPGYYLNLPSISVPDLRYTVVISRKITNVAEVDAVYHAAIESPPGVKMDVEPPVLVFNAANKVKLSPLRKLQGDYTFGSLTWHNGQKTLYIAYLGEKKHDDPTLVTGSHHDMLSSIIGRSPQKFFFSWDMLGLNYRMPTELLHRTNYGEEIIIGIVDTGIWPESRSFSDEGYGPVPARWRGVCQVGEGWDSNNCSRKIVGARFYHAGVDEENLKIDYLSPRDANGHGTHTASTAAGSVVEAVSFHGLAEGTARGGAPRARIAVYKSMWGSGSGVGSGNTATVLAAIDDAIHDGVDVLSLSLGTLENSFGALHAVQKGITVVYAAMNLGPAPQVVQNTAPWVITVAASKIDRSFPTVITLGDKRQIVVRYLQTSKFKRHDTNTKNKSVPRPVHALIICTVLMRIKCSHFQGQSLYSQGMNSSLSGFRRLVVEDALNGTDVKGSIVLCASFTLNKPSILFQEALGNVVKGGGIGMIFVLYTEDIVSSTARCNGIACVIVDYYTVKQIGRYILSASSPIVKIDPARTVTGNQIMAPKVADFSSRGPSTDYPEIIKPDIAAPGSNILAAVKGTYAFASGTSMATPHVAGVVALLKALHPSWSPAALKSAIVTTASVTDERGMPILAEGLPRKIADPFDYGGGHINPNRAADPGLIYDIDPRDYNKFFGCTVNPYVSCNATLLPGYYLNLPSISVPDLRYTVVISRKITNVAEVDAVYHAAIESPPGVKMDVEPPVLVFNAANKVKLSPLRKLQGDYTFGSLTWHNGQKTLYIAYLGEKKHDDPTLVTGSHHDMLSKLPEVISITPNQKHELMTTRSWDFLGLKNEPPSELLQRSNYGEDIIIEIIDTGIWPESKSFSDHGYDAIPSRWKGVCQLGEAWGPSNCSRKIIGARYYAAGLDKANFKKNYMSARDNNGHGTHTASTAAGVAVEGVNLHGLGAGVARGGASRARLAVYKVGWEEGGAGGVYLATAAVLAALDDAIHDGVDILSLSLVVDENSFGALHAVQNGITVVYAGGNSGPRPQVLYNTAPWSQRARLIDLFQPPSPWENKRTLVGQSFYYKLKNETESRFESLVNGGNCSRDVLNGTSINGKVVLCIELTFGPMGRIFKDVFAGVIQGGASGLILAFYTTDVLLSTEDCKGIACVFVDNEIGYQVATYIGSERLPTVKIEPASSITGNQVPAPKVAIFSSRGPSIKYPTVLKPDIAAPGVNILAAKEDAYVFNSGTSMAAPHVAGVVALLKALHPHWSHAALKSAIVTTASTKDEYGTPILAEALPRKVADPFDYGGGNINPIGAADPGLIYDIDPKDYNKFFGCQIKKYEICNIINITTLPAYHLNLPSISIPDLRHPINVDAVYQSSIESPLGVKMTIEPPVLVFNASKKVHAFKVCITPLWKVQGGYTFGSLTWYNEHHTARIPIAVRITIQDFYADVA